MAIGTQNRLEILGEASRGNNGHIDPSIEFIQGDPYEIRHALSARQILAGSYAEIKVESGPATFIFDEFYAGFKGLLRARMTIKGIENDELDDIPRNVAVPASTYFSPYTRGVVVVSGQEKGRPNVLSFPMDKVLLSDLSVACKLGGEKDLKIA